MHLRTLKSFYLSGLRGPLSKKSFVEGSGSDTTSQSAALDSSSNPPKPRTRSETTHKSVALGSSRNLANFKINLDSNAKANRTCGFNKGGKKAREAVQITASHHTLRAFLR